ncbi:MAG: MFS transporter [Oligoflexales bacterium]|nr:MFS transporter [Oligoflexales bacterium]
MFTYAFMQIPAGIILDRYGPRKAITFAILILSLGLLLVAKTEYYPLAILGRLLLGVGSAFGFLGTSKIVSLWFSLKAMPLLLGSAIFLGSLGGAFSKEICSLLPENWEWRQSIVGIAYMGLLLAFVIWFLLKEAPVSGENFAQGKTPKKPILSQLALIIKNKQIFLGALFTFFAYLPISILGDSWGPLAFEKMFDAHKDLADKTVVFFYIAFSLGSFFYSSAAYRLRNIRTVLMFACCVTVIFLYLLLFQTQVGCQHYFGIPGFLILTFLVAFNLGGVPLAFSIGCAHASKIRSWRWIKT